ncbi:thymidine kinase [Bacillus phage PBC2]|uniref:Thymidine kinase n=1 Tax=Bacillus phage PBC2 TaxID=1675029 RepID=A0A218KC72_9CAUD|nr:thymidine kinase [Bacillus phage PBC2]AKQ08499.1 putative tymidine kinase [Bacillus phage PBC2]
MRKKELILGTMSASKSAQLMMQAFNLERQGKKVLVFKPETDTRDGAFVASRALQEKRPAIVIKKTDVDEMKRLIKIEKPDVVMLDELQFFTVEQVEELAFISTLEIVDIYAYGLLLSYTGRMFEPTKRAIECGFRIALIKMQCDKCSNNATNHLLYMDGVLQLDGDGITVEDFKNKQQEYLSVCYSCYHDAIEVHKLKEHKSKK